MREGVPEDAAGSLAPAGRERILGVAHRMDAVALGPGLSLHPETQELARALVAEVERPLVADADALSALAGHPDLLRRALGPRALTPHPRAMPRILPLSADPLHTHHLHVT